MSDDAQQRPAYTGAHHGQAGRTQPLSGQPGFEEALRAAGERDRASHYADQARIAELEQRCEVVFALLAPFHDPDDPEDTSAGARAMRAARGDTK